MKPLSALVLLAGLWAASLPACAVPTDITAAYRVFRNGILVGRVDEHYVRTGASYRIISEVRSDGALNWFVRDRLQVTSEGRITSAGLEPGYYEYSRLHDNRKSVRASFNWDRKVMESAYGGTTETVPLQPGTQDRLSVMYQFMHDIPRTVEIRSWMTNGKKVEQYVYRKQGDVQLKSLAGDFNTVHYVREARADEDAAELWLAKDQHYLPVRVVFTDRNGVRSEQALISLSVR